ncbi:hypothetical protein Tco_1388020 [Tanacetum coccineum]
MIFPNALHGYFCRHLMMNCKLKSDKLQCIFWKTCKAYIAEEFQRRISDLRGLRPEAYQKLEDVGFETWSRAMCLANRYNYMTSNSVESINNLTRHVRKAPITMLMEWYKALLQKWYCARREKYQDSSFHTLSDWATHKVMDIMQKNANWKVYGIYQAVGRVMGCTDCSDMALVVKPPNMNFSKAGRPKNTDRIKSQHEEPIQVRCSRCGVRGHTRASCHEPIPNYQTEDVLLWLGNANIAFDLRLTEDVLPWPGNANMAFDLRPTEDILPWPGCGPPFYQVRPIGSGPFQTIRQQQSRPESNIRNNFSGRSQQYEAAYSYNHGRLQEYAQAYNNMIRRSQEYEPAYTNMIGRSQEYEPAYNNMIGRSQVYSPAYNNNNRKSQDYESAYNNMIGRSQEYSPAYNNNNGRSQEYEAAYNNINFSGMAQDPHLTMPFACNQFNFGQTSQQIDSSMSFTWDPIN